MKKVEMEKVLRCADVSGTSCQFVARGRTMDDILQQAGKHAAEDHGLAVTPELVEAVKAASPRSDAVRHDPRRCAPSRAVATSQSSQSSSLSLRGRYVFVR